MSAASQCDERIIILTPSANDGPATAKILTNAGFECIVARDTEQLCELAQAGAAAVILALEVLTPSSARRIANLLVNQEPWSDLPIIVFTDPSSAPPVLNTLTALAPLGNVTVLHRPVHLITIISAAGAAVRARRRQYGARALLVERQAVFEAAPIAIFVTHDRGARTTRGNRCAAEILRLPIDANLSKSAPLAEMPTNFRVFKEGKELRAEELPVQRAAAEGIEIRDCELDVVFDNGDVLHLYGNAAPLLAADGSPAGAVGAFVDLTARKEAENALREADRRKTEFLGLLSHELRNPLAPIRTSIYLLARAAPGSEQARRARQVIERQTEHLSRLVDDLLDVNRISHGKIELRRKPIEVGELVHRACEDHRSLLEVRGIKLQCEIGGPTWIDADPTRLAQIVGNLLQNAAKCSAQGSSVFVSVEKGDRSAEIRVRDQGIGIPAELLPRLFVPFVQAEDGRSAKLGGLGLGLSLVKGLVELHGGSVRALSDGPDRGAEFVVTLPLIQAPSRREDKTRPAVAVRGTTANSPKRSFQVLLIDDNADVAESLAEALEQAGHRVHVSLDGRTGLARARELVPDVVVCDIGLPDVTGYEVAQTLRSEANGRRQRLIALSGYAQAQDRERAIEAGFDAHLAKPVGVEELSALLSGSGQD